MKKLLKKESTRSYLMGIATVLGVYGLVKIGCGVLTLNILLAIATIALANSMKVRKNFSRKFRVIVGGAIIFLLLGIGVYHAANCHKVVLTEKNDSAVVDTTKDEVPVQEEQKVEDKKETPVVSKGTDRSGSITYDKNGYAVQDKKDEVTFHNVQNEDGSKGSTSVEGQKEQTFEAPSKKESEKDIVFSQPEEKSSNETKEAKEEEAPKSNGNVVTDQKKSDEMFEEAFKEETKSNQTVKSEATIKDSAKKAETKSSTTTNETTKPETKEAPKTSTQASSEKQEEKRESIQKPIRVEALDSYSAYVGESIQFKIEGENVQFEGLEGMDYVYNKGILTIECGEYATVLTVRVFNNSNSVDFNVYINGLR